VNSSAVNPSFVVGDRVCLRTGVLPKVTGSGREGVILSMWRPRDGRVFPSQEYVHAIRFGHCEKLFSASEPNVLAIVQMTPDDGLGAPLEAVLSLQELAPVGPALKLRRCQSCPKPEEHAVISYVWPGKGRVWPGKGRTFVCLFHWLKVCQVAAALGLSLKSLDAHRFQDHVEEFTAEGDA
jgi:hypothetical protein